MVSLRQLGVAAMYALLVWLSLVCLSPERANSILFLANGFALAMLLHNLRYIGAIFLGALASDTLLGYPLETILLLSVGSVLGAYLGTWLLSRDKVFDVALVTTRDYLLLIVYGGFVGSAVSAGLGVTGLLSAGILAHETQLNSLFLWWLGGVLGVILITPLILVWTHPSKEPFPKQKLSEALWVVAVAFVAGQIVFIGWFAALIGYSIHGYWVALPIIWAALRLGKRWVALLLVMAAIQAVLGTNWEAGFFAHDIASSRLGNYWLFVMSLALAGMMLSIYIEQRQQAETRLRQQSEELNFRNQILQQINQGASLPHVLSVLTQEFERLHPSSWCAMLLLDKEGKHLHYGAASGLPDFYKRAINGLPIGEGVGACGAAVRRGERVIISDMQNYTFWPVGFRFRDAAKKAGIQSCWSQPIKNSEHRVLGTFDIYHAANCQPSAVEIDSMERMAHLAAQVIDQAGLQEILHLKDAAFNVSANAMVITDKDARIQWANPAFSEMTGYLSSDVLGLNLRDLGKSEKQDPAYYQTIWKTILAGNVWHGELVHRHKNGADYDEEMTITPMKDAAENVTHFIAVMSNITERKKSEEQIRTLAFYDTLTQLPNRRLLDDRLGRAMIASKRSNRYGALMFLDLDNFKPLNDKYGHGTGDLLLIEVAQRITQCVRGTDTVARFGGDEFVVMLDGLGADRNESINEAEIVAEKIRRALAEPFMLSTHKEGRGEVGIEHRCSTSIGVALFIGDGVSCDDLLKRADMAMYRAKDKGRNRVHFFDARHA
ncbi:sensor domain-containing diguanylate cyclase [Rugosibacter aromaticivorans]|uniref:sensor domain-containing diguanylate cyclase n=1 Tax=Rugosibacter aromaticivorans TaxID=1565605 RepID=UPI000A89431E|nr:sensor domain-containing diguanylate cyclase [Rugosibacter aromaticivorans]